MTIFCEITIRRCNAAKRISSPAPGLILNTSAFEKIDEKTGLPDKAAELEPAAAALSESHIFAETSAGEDII
jgi:hypothetical protein